MLKRALDVALASAGLALGAPILLGFSAAVRLDTRGPILFRQARVGRGGATFEILKFRTMVVGAESMGTGLYTADGDSRITRVGAWLRRTSLDELPQLWNILVGDMSLVGPRPTVASQVEQYDAFQRRRLEVKPGVTGWAQIHGRNSLSWPERIQHDVWYVDHQSFLLDLRILYRTVPVLFRGDGVYAPPERFVIRPGGQDHPT